MRLAIDIHALETENWAGKEQYLFQLIKSLDKQPGVEIFLYSRQKIGRIQDILSDRSQLVAKKLPTPLWQFWLLKELRRKKIDHFLAPCTYLASALNLHLPQTVIIHDLSTLLPATRKTHPLISQLKEKLIISLALRNSRNIIAISENTKKDLIKYFPSQAGKVEVIYQGLRFPLADGGQKKEPVILSVGTIEPRKNIPLVVKAFEEIKEARPDINWRLVIIGKIGWKAEALLKTVKESPASSSITLAGYVTDQALLEYYQRSLCLVYPSIYEGFGLPPLEAMASGCPVIVPRHSSLPEVTGEAGIFFDSEQEISVNIFKLLSEPNWREGIIAKGFAQAKKFNWDKAAAEIVSLLNKNRLEPKSYDRID